MSDEHDYSLGKDVTQHATGKTKGSIVLSVRLGAEELAEIEALCHMTGKNLSQVVREAVREFVHAERAAQPTITISVEDVVTTSTGTPSRATGLANYAKTFQVREAALV